MIIELSLLSLSSLLLSFSRFFLSLTLALIKLWQAVPLFAIRESGEGQLRMPPISEECRDNLIDGIVFEVRRRPGLIFTSLSPRPHSQEVDAHPHLLATQVYNAGEWVLHKGMLAESFCTFTLTYSYFNL